MIKERGSLLKDLLVSGILNRPRIFWATIYLTYACNYKCRHCYGSYGECHGTNISDENQLSFEQIHFIVKELHKQGCRYIAFLGGEPLLHKDIQQIVRMVRTFGIELSIITNGSLLKQRIDKVKEVSTLCFSIDGDDESNDFLRGKGAYRRSLEAIVTAKKLGINVHINATIYRNSIRHMDALFEFSKKNKIYLGFCPLMYQSYQNDRYEELRPSDNDYREFYKKIIYLKKNNWPIMYSAASYRTIQRWPDFNNVIIWKNDIFDINDIDFPLCFAGRHFVYIGANGDVYPCSQLIGAKQFCPKNTFKDGFAVAWQHAMNIPCKACTSIGFLDINSILAFRLKPFCSMAGQSLREILWQRKNKITG